MAVRSRRSGFARIWKALAAGNDVDRTACFVLGLLMVGFSTAVLTKASHLMLPSVVCSLLGMLGVYLLYVALFGSAKQLSGATGGVTDPVLLAGLAAIALPLAMLLKWLQLRTRKARRRRRTSEITLPPSPGTGRVTEVVAVLFGIVVCGALIGIVPEWPFPYQLLLSCVAGAIVGAVFGGPDDPQSERKSPQ